MRSSTDRYLYLAAIALFLALIIAYSNHFNNTFHFDDGHTIVDNPAIRDLKNIPRFFVDPSLFSADPGHYGMRPLLTTTLAIDYWFAGGLDPFYFQLDAFVWHLCVCLLVFGIARRLLLFTFEVSRARWLALITAGWYGLHTANAETVNYIIARSDVLSTFCIALSFYLYVVYPLKRKYLLYVLPAALGVFAKETVTVLLIVLFFYRLLFEADESKSLFANAFKAFVALLPATLIIAAAQLYALSHTTGLHGATNAWSPYVLTQTYVWRQYFYNFFFPIHLSADTDLTIIQHFNDKLAAGLIFIVFLIAMLVLSWKRRQTRVICFGLLWFAAALLPTSLVPFAEVMNDHRMYFPFIGLAIAVVGFCGIIFNQLINRARYADAVAAIITIIVISLNAYGVYQRNKIWHTEESLWKDVTIKSPLNGRGLMNYGLTQMSKGRYDTAAVYFARAQKLLPSYSTLYINLGVLNGAVAKHPEAEANFKKAIALGSDSYEPFAFYARYLLSQQRKAEARNMAQKALALNPQSVMAQIVLSKTTGSQPETPEDWLDVSLALYQSGKYQACIDACRKALKLKPNYADAWNNIGAAYNGLQQWDKAVKALTSALQINNKHKLAKGNLEWAKKRLDYKLQN